MSVLQKSLMLAASAGLVLLAFSADTSSATTVTLKANISFERVIDVGMASDVTFGEVQARPSDKVTLDPAGGMSLEGKGELLAPHGRPSVITIGDSRGQIMNFLLANYSLGPGMESLHARCVLKGTNDLDCDQAPISGKREATLFLGMDMTVGNASSVDNTTEPSFDVSIVYQ